MDIDFRRIALSAGIAIVATILVAMSARAIFPSAEPPKCQERLFAPPESVAKLSDQEREDCQRQVDEFERKERAASKNQFFVLMGGSVLLLVIGSAMYTILVVASGILWGGVIALFYSLIMSFRPGLEDYYRLAAAVVAFVVLIILAYRMFGKERKAKQ
jgi:predicted cobalt transporter CbtA